MPFCKFTLGIFLSFLLVFNPWALAQKAELPVPAPGKHLYYLSKPEQSDTQIRTTAKALYYGISVAVITGTAIKTGIHLGAFWAAVTAIWSTAKTAIYLRGLSTLEQHVKQRIKSRQLLKALQVIPGISRAFLVTSSTPEFQGPLTTKMHNTSHLIVETDQIIEASDDFVSSYGTPLEITDSEKTHIELSLIVESKVNKTLANLTLDDIFKGITLDPQTTENWRNQAGLFQKERKFFEKEFSRSRDFEISIAANLVFPDGKRIDMGELFSGGEVLGFLRMGHLQKLSKDRSLSMPLNLTERSYVDSEECIANMDSISTESAGEFMPFPLGSFPWLP